MVQPSLIERHPIPIPESDSSKFAGRLLGHFLTNWTPASAEKAQYGREASTIFVKLPFNLWSPK